MKQQFIEKLHLSPTNRKKLATVNSIIDEYIAEGYKLTLRQLYYQLVSRDIIPNKQAEYAKLSSILVKGRMAGMVDWDAIEDRIRVPFIPYWVTGIEDALNDTKKQYRLNRQRDQKVYVEVHIEKDALSGVLKRVTSYYHINLVVNRGYSSCSAIYDAYKRMRVHEDLGQKCYIFYLGDHDPSGLDMIRDIKDRLVQFDIYPKIIPLALTMKQIQKYNPPPNPAKVSDPRAEWYISKYGDVSWEVDALEPKTLISLVSTALQKLIDVDKFNTTIEQEKEDKKKIEKLIIIEG